ncbi:TrkA family potassium uptake protein [Acinetobacter chinensis]|jgi:trk system potassium uptake protein TrkA|uniref:TrkA family potassium uptake protein n=1 Tax=Acinetobacter chinensis TaxID=2004650 RepID=A0A3B7LX89_9GAMM|nr:MULTISPECIES: TrkA family potassium uptake protein [Acinetobacter]AXY56584.1 TrkA family potassium uptake protein [Acinetobacter chinensis]AXY59971.1 TrkA family potassium uptake protein [Acinetobacter sp. WCHAc010052]MDV2468272.1 TrkA family potassium uptake protein [Acinetobacter chinensis]WOE43028.1 TrkA family potassium uptake protein [Acinetobacter chinensis]
MAQFAVIGLGSFGATVATELAALNHDVIGIDSNKKFVESISDTITHAVIADATDERVLDELNVKNCDAVVVAIGDDIEASILCVLHLKNLGIEKIMVKAKSKAHHMILSHLGITKIIHPEEDMGIRIAQSLSYPMVRRYMALNNNRYIVKAEITTTLKGAQFQALMDNSPEIKSLMLQRGSHVIYEIAPGTILQEKDILIIEGPLESLRQLSSRFL